MLDGDCRFDSMAICDFTVNRRRIVTVLYANVGLFTITITITTRNLVRRLQIERRRITMSRIQPVT